MATDARLHFLCELIPKPVPLSEAIEYQNRMKTEHGETTMDMVGEDEEFDEEGLNANNSPEVEEVEHLSEDDTQLTNMEES